MKVAALDLGTNSFLCLIAEVENSIITKEYSDQVEIVRLGQDVNRTKMFHPDALARAEKALQVFKEKIDFYKPEKIQAYATSAARDVTNREVFFDLFKKYQIPLEIISGDKEAEFTFFGGISHLPQRPHYAVVDIGGGSTEIIFGDKTKINFAHSFDVGTVRLKEMFLQNEIPTDKEWRNFQDHIQKSWQPYLAKMKVIADSDAQLVAVAGTPTEIAKIEIGYFDAEKIDRMTLALNQLETWMAKLSAVPHADKISIYGATPGRADVIAPGVFILLNVMKMLSKTKVTVSTKGLRYGIAQKI